MEAKIRRLVNIPSYFIITCIIEGKRYYVLNIDEAGRLSLIDEEQQPAPWELIETRHIYQVSYAISPFPTQFLSLEDYTPDDLSVRWRHAYQIINPHSIAITDERGEPVDLDTCTNPAVWHSVIASMLNL